MSRLYSLNTLHITLSMLESTILISDSLFENQRYPTRIKSVTNLFHAALCIKVESGNFAHEQDSEFNPSKVETSITNSVFKNNERGATFFGVYKYLLVYNCVFENNTAVHAGAGILVLISGPQSIIMEFCVFRSNKAGRFHNSYAIEEMENEIKELGNEVRLL